MTYETEGYVKSVKISANSTEETELDFVPTGAYLLEENGQAYCMFKAVTLDGKEEGNVVEATLLRLDKAKSVSMQIKTGSLRDALITAKVNHSKIRVEIDASFFNKVYEDLYSEEPSLGTPNGKPSEKMQKGKDPIITAVEFV